MMDDEVNHPKHCLSREIALALRELADLFDAHEQRVWFSGDVADVLRDCAALTIAAKPADASTSEAA